MLDLSIVAAALAPLELPRDELESLVAALGRFPRPGVRLRPGIEPAILPFATESVPWHPRGRFITEAVRPGGFVAFAAGDYYIQDASSLLAVTMLAAQPGEMICDLCAAPGGKSTAILEALDDSGWLLANEAVHARAAALEFNLARHGSPRYIVTRRDPDRLAQMLPEFFDAVLVDAPCSGQSLVARGKQSEAAFLPKTMAHCAARQIRILEAAAQLVRPGGRMVYATCTLAHAENEQQIDDFLQRHSEWIAEPVPGLETRLWPHRTGCGGAFAARLRKTGNATGSDRSAIKPIVRGANSDHEHAEWGALVEVVTGRSELWIHAWPSDVPSELISMAEGGPEIAFRKGTTWFPSYALAMRREANWSPRQIVELDDQQAEQFVRGETVRGATVGWSVATWRGRPLGWVKGDGKQLKNHLPKPGRLTGGREMKKEK